jgi:hypothetical protein
VDGKLNMVDVDGNGQTLYFVPEEDYLIGANKAQSSNLKIYLKDNKVTRINFITKPDAVYYPIDLLSPNDAKLENFRWYGEFRPLKKMDVFKWQ